MKEYAIVEGDAPKVVIEEVARRLNDGWELVGGLQVAAYYDPNNSTAGRVVYAQAMTKEALKEMASA